MARSSFAPWNSRLALGPLLLVLGQAFTELPALAPAVEGATLEAHVRYLASDELEGRATAGEGARLAAQYLASVLEAQGLEPVGDEGFVQTVPLVRRSTVRAPELTWLDAAGVEHRARAGIDFDVTGGDGSTGMLALEVLARGAEPPGGEEPRALFVDGRGELRRLEQASSGALAGYPLLVLPGSAREGEPWRPAGPGRLQREDAARAPGVPIVRLRGELARRIESGELRALGLVQEVLLEAAPCRNVVGRIGGVGTVERPELAGEVVVLTAHYDHIGLDERARERAHSTDPPREVDYVFNGADDDASGVAAVLELAHALAAGPPPARTVLVLLVTGEEIGLLGTEHYLDNPLLPLERTVVNLNFEMLGRADALVGGPGRMWLTGPERTNLLQAFRGAELPILEDPRPDQNFFFRSDNIAFARRGMVAQTLSSYNMHQDYHRVTDRPETLEYEHMAQAVGAALEAVRLIADGRVDPAWLPGGLPTQR